MGLKVGLINARMCSKEVEYLSSIGIKLATPAPGVRSTYMTFPRAKISPRVYLIQFNSQIIYQNIRT